MTKKDTADLPKYPPKDDTPTSASPGSVKLAASGARPAIPAAQAAEIRRIVHDLSNALEIIIQSSYLLSTSDLPEESRQWVKLLEQGVQQSAGINQALRAYIIAHS